MLIKLTLHFSGLPASCISFCIAVHLSSFCKSAHLCLCIYCVAIDLKHVGFLCLAGCLTISWHFKEIAFFICYCPQFLLYIVFCNVLGQWFLSFLQLFFHFPRSLEMALYYIGTIFLSLSVPIL